MSRFGLSIAIALPLVLAALAFAVANKDTPLATLGNEAIREADFQHYLARAYPPERVKAIHRDPAERSQALEEYLDHRAVAEKARRVGIDQETRFKKAVELMEIKTLAHLMTERHRESILRSSRVSPDEVKTYYEQHKNELSVEPRFTAHHLLVYVKGNPAFPEKGLGDAKARTKAQAGLARLRAGASWDDVAKTYSDDVATKDKSGLIRDAQFGYHAPEVERAVRMQELGKPGEVIKSMFGYHVLQVEDRITERAPQPFEQAKEVLTERLTQQRSAEARQAFMAPIWREVGFRIAEAGKRDGPLLDENAVAPEELLAEVGGKPVREADFRWFLKDALLPSQRRSAYSRPGARQGMLTSFLDMLVLAVKARKERLDRAPDFVRHRDSLRDQLVAEFLQGRDRAGPLFQPANSDQERQRAQREYLDRVRAEVGLHVAAGRQ